MNEVDHIFYHCISWSLVAMGIHSCNESQSFGFLRMLSIVWTSIWTSEAEEVIEELQQLQTRRQNESWRIISH